MAFEAASRRRRVSLLISVAVGLGAAVAASSPAVATDPPPNRVAVASRYDGVHFDLLTDDAVYVSQEVPGVSDEIYRLPLRSDETGTTVLPPEYVGSAAMGSDFAVHDGEVAYLRAEDRAVVRQAADGTETVLGWAPAGDFAWGVQALTSHWIVGEGATDRLPTAYALESGVKLDLLGMSQVPAQSGAQVRNIAITDDRAAWLVLGTTSPPTYGELLTVALGTEAPAEPATSIGRYSGAALSEDTFPYGLPEIIGTTVFWQHATSPPAGYGTRFLTWRSAAPYNATPSSVSVPEPANIHYWGGGPLISRWLFSETGVTQFAATWHPAANPAATLWSTGRISGRFEQARGPLYVYSTEEGGYTSWLADVSGRPVRAEGWIPPIGFTDVGEGEVFEREIMWMARTGLTTGYPDGTFRRQATVNRDAMAAFLYRLTHDGASAPACSEAAFADVPSSHPFCGEIAWLADSGVTTGWPDGTFRPGAPVTREAMAAFLFRLHDGGEPSTPSACGSPPFADVQTSHPFCGAITWLARSGVSTGWPDHTFRPGAPVERQAMAAFLRRFVAYALVP